VEEAKGTGGALERADYGGQNIRKFGSIYFRNPRYAECSQFSNLGYYFAPAVELPRRTLTTTSKPFYT